jgi:hypothetical protein
VYIYIYKLNLEFYSFKLFSLKLKFECHLYNGSRFNLNARPIELFLPPSGLPPSLLLLRRHPPSVVPPTSSMSNNGHPPRTTPNSNSTAAVATAAPPLRSATNMEQSEHERSKSDSLTWSNLSKSGPNLILRHEQSEHERSRDTISVIQFTSLLYYLRYR